MRKMESVVSQITARKRMTDKELAEKVLQYVPDAYSKKTLQVLCASTRYLSFIGALEFVFGVDSALVERTDSCKF